MNRRDLLVGATVGAAATTLTGRSAEAALAPPKFDAAEVESALGRLDQRMASFQALDLLPPIANGEPTSAELGRSSELTRAALRTIYFTGALMELEEHQRYHPGVQLRIKRMAREMDASVGGMTDLLESLTPEDHRRLQATLKSDPGLGMRIGERLHKVATDDGFGFQRRVDLRLAFKDLSDRMRAQNPALLMDPYVKKSRRIQANPGTPEDQQRMVMAKIGEEAFWAFQERSVGYVGAWDRAYAARPREYLAGVAQVYPDDGGGVGESDGTIVEDEWAKSEGRVEDPLEKPMTILKGGLGAMGIGVGTMAAGGLFYLLGAATGAATGGAGAIFLVPAVILGITVGPIIVAIGLLATLVGAVYLLGASL